MRIAAFDYIKVVMKVFIIVTHVVLITAEARAAWLFPFWIDQAVPFFWMISAYLFARAFDRHGSSTARDELVPARLWPRLKRVLLPYTVVFALIIALAAHRHAVVSGADALFGTAFFRSIDGGGVPRAAASVAALFVGGGPGPGGYYIPCLFQMYVLLPFVCASMKRRPGATVAVCLLATAALELLAVGGVVSASAYRLLVVRYLPHLLLGAGLYRLGAKRRLALFSKASLAFGLAGALGAAYLAAVCYGGMAPLSVPDWKATATFTVMYSGSLFYFALVLFGGGDGVEPVRKAGRSAAVEYCSRAALHVYIFQMLYYYLVNDHLALMAHFPLPFVIAASVAICMSFGIGHYALETAARKAIGGHGVRLASGSRLKL